MSNYTPVTNFASKDTLATGNALKALKGAELTTEFVAIQTAVNSKFDGVATFAPDGTAAQPSFGFTNNAGTGMYNTAGVLSWSTAGVQRMSVAIVGNVVVNAPASGVAFTATAAVGQFAAKFNSAASGAQSGVQIQAGASATDVAFEVVNQPFTLNSFIVYGDTGATVGNLSTSPGAGILNALNGLQINGVPIVAGIPQNLQSGSYTLVLADANKHLAKSGAGAATWTIPSNASVPYPIGTAITFVGTVGAGTVTLAINTDTLTWLPSNATGTRTLTSGFMVTALKVTPTIWAITGVGIS